MNLLFIQDEAPVAVESADAPVAEVVTEVGTEIPAETAAETQPAGGGYTFWIMIIAMIAIMYFFMWRPESKR
ncbi:MAG: hypothetical protein IJ464_05620, partial [Alistipes sp.]|nr:hypothetical protein [Alistipes sp.]